MAAAFGQVAPLTTTLRNVLRDYGAPQLLNEQLQNADDAGARVFKVLLSDKRHATNCISPALAKWQGAALYVFDDAEFGADDFVSIQHVGDGVKRGDPTKTGQFGLGFNSCYHCTDVPSFVSGGKFAVFDPHQTHGLPGNGAGALYDVRSVGVRDQLRDHLAAFKIEDFGGYDGAGGWAASETGTIFRLPLRDAKSAKASRISGKAMTVDDAWREVVAPFVDLVHRRLLFLKSVERIEVWRETKGQRQCVSACRVAGDFAATRPQRRALIDAVRLCMGKEMKKCATDAYEEEPLHSKAYHAAMQKRPKLPTPHFRLEIHCSQGALVAEERWLVATAFGGADDVDFGASSRTRAAGLFALMPYAACACRVDGSPVEGRLYVSLPTPISTGLCAHVDARFELSRDRNALCVDTATGGAAGPARDGADAVRAEWNKRMMRLAGGAHAKCVALLAAEDKADVRRLLPKSDAKSPFAALHAQLYAQLLDVDCFEVSTAWCSARRAVFDDPDADGRATPPFVLKALQDVGCAVVRSARAPEFRAVSPGIRVVSPQVVLDYVDAYFETIAAVLRGLERGDRIAWCRHVLAYVASSHGCVVKGLPVVLQDGSVGRLDDSRFSINLAAARDNTIIVGHARLLLDDSSLALLVEDDGGDAGSAARQLWRGHASLSSAAKPFGPLQAVQLSLPAAWHGRARVEASAAQMKWLGAFWAAFGDEPFKDLEDWPLVACAGGEAVRLGDAHRVLLPSASTRANDTALLFAAVAALGVDVAADADVAPGLARKMAKLSGAAVVDAIAALPTGEAFWDATLGADPRGDARAALLDLCAADAATLDDSRLEAHVSTAPLFLYDDGARRPLEPRRAARHSRPAGHGGSKTTPTGRVLCDLRLLAPPKPHLVALYGRLGVSPLPRAVFWQATVSDSAAFALVDASQRLSVLRDLFREYEEIREDLLPSGETFETFFGRAKCFWSEGDASKLFAAADLADPREALNLEFGPANVPCKDLFDLLPFLERAGMPRGLRRDKLLAYARLVDAAVGEGCDEVCLKRAALIVKAIFGRFAEVCDGETSWVKQLGPLRLARPAYSPPTRALAALQKRGLVAPRVVEASRGLLVPFQGSVVASSSALREHASSWSRAVAVQTHGSYAPTECVALLGAASFASVDDVFDHVINVASLDVAAFDAWDEEYRSSRLTRGPRPVGAGVSDELRYSWDAVVNHLVARSPSAAKKRLQALGAERVVPLREPRRAFAPVESLFSDLKRDAPPFALRLDRAHDCFLSAAASYFNDLGIGQKPPAVALRKWAEKLRDEAARPSRRAVDTAVSLARLYDEVAVQGDAHSGALIVPSTEGLLRPACTLFYDDSPWLDGRVDKARCGVVHRDLDDVAARLGCAPLSRGVAESAVDVIALDAGVDVDVSAALALWSANLRSAAFGSSLRRAIRHSQRDGASDAQAQLRLARLRHLTIRAAARIESRFSVLRQDGSRDDVTASSTGSQAVLDDAAGTLYVLYEVANGGVRRGWRRRWLPAIAIAIDRFVGAGAIRERAVFAELLSVDDSREMAEVLDTWEIPTPQWDHGIGEAYDVNDGDPRAVEANEFAPGALVLVPATGDSAPRFGGDGAPWMTARVAAVLSAEAVLCVVSPDGETAAVDMASVRRRPTAQERVLEKTATARAARAAFPDDAGERLDGLGAGPEGRLGAGGGGAAVSAADRVVFYGAEGWRESEVAARRELARRTRERLASSPAEAEPPGVDAVLVRHARAEDVAGVAVNFSSASVGVVRKERVTKGYNIVRIGNFREDDDAVADVAFFHAVPTLDEIFDRGQVGLVRRRLVRQCCGALRKVCGCFGVDAALVTLFYDAGAASRFVRQKLFLNVAPVDARRSLLNLADVRTDAFVYAYFYGLLIHKLAHFFDVVHGTRHEFFMDEYRAHFALAWISLLCDLGFDPEQVARDFPDLLWDVVT